MGKRALLWACCWLSLSLPSMANQANVAFQSTDATLLLVKIDGKPVNYIPQLGLRVLNLFPGNHTVDFQLIDNMRGESIKYSAVIYLEPLTEASYLLYRSSNTVFGMYLSSKFSLTQPSIYPIVSSGGGLTSIGYTTTNVPSTLNTTGVYPSYVVHYDMMLPKRQETAVKPDFDICSRVLSSGMADTIASAIRGYSLDADKYRVAKLGVAANGLRVQDMKRILQEFNWDETKLNFVRTTYPYICDKQSFFHLRGLFKHVETERELEEYVSAVNMIR